MNFLRPLRSPCQLSNVHRLLLRATTPTLKIAVDARYSVLGSEASRNQNTSDLQALGFSTKKRVSKKRTTSVSLHQFII